MAMRSLRWLWHALLEGSLLYGTYYYPVPLIPDSRLHDRIEGDNSHDVSSNISSPAPELGLGSAVGAPGSR
jgi:hypothetical protein